MSLPPRGPKVQRTFNLSHRSREPFPRTHKPESDAIYQNNTHRDNGVVEGLARNGVDLWEDKENGDEDDPECGDNGDG